MNFEIIFAAKIYKSHAIKVILPTILKFFKKLKLLLNAH